MITLFIISQSGSTILSINLHGCRKIFCVSREWEAERHGADGARGLHNNLRSSKSQKMNNFVMIITPNHDTQHIRFGISN